VDTPGEIVVQAASYAAVAVPSLLAAGGLWVWRRPRMTPLPQLRHGLWSGRDVLFAYLLMFFIPVLILGFLRGSSAAPEAAEQEDFLRQVLWVMPVALPAILAFDFFLMNFLASTRPAEIGFSFVRIVPNLICGVVAFVLAAPIVLGVHLVFLQFWTTQLHPLEKLALNRSLSVTEWGLLWFQATIYAPIIEEWFFRGVLQGWLRRASPLGHAVFLAGTFATGAIPLYGQFATPPKPTAVKADTEPAGAQAVPETLDSALAMFTFTALLATIYGFIAVRRWQPLLREGVDWFLPAEMKTTEAPAEPTDPAEEDDDLSEEELEDLEEAEVRRMHEIMRQPKWRAWQQSLAHLAIFGSAMFFAVSHSTWPNPIPLFLLGLVLGWVRLKTQNLWPCILLHSLFNHVAFVGLMWGAVNR